MKRLIIFSSMFVILTTSAWAQPGPNDGPAPDMGYMPPRNVEAVRIYKLTQALNLTDVQITTFIPALQKHEQAVREEQKKLMTIMDEGRTLFNEDQMSQKEVNKFMDKVNGQQARIQTMNQDFLKSLDKYLTPRQQLQYLGFEVRFRRQLRDFIQDRQAPAARQKMMDKRRP